MRILLVTDAWLPQVNGVVRTLSTLVEHAEALGHQVLVVHPGGFRTVPCPTYPSIRLSAFPGPGLAAMLDCFDPDAVHVATEGPLGAAARQLCLRRGIPFTTAFCTRFPEYLYSRLRLPTRLGYLGVRWFHRAAERTMVATRSLREELAGHGIARTALVPRGVDTRLFRPRGKAALDHLPRPVFLTVGRVAVEKNLEAFLDLELPGSKVVVGDGPARAALERKYPDARFLGARHGEELAGLYSAADCFVFPSRTDTFGLVMLESLACGVPVAAFPVPGPLDVLGDAAAGVLDEDLRAAALRALEIPAAACVEHARGFRWEQVTRAFLAALAVRPGRSALPGLPRAAQAAG